MGLILIKDHAGEGNYYTEESFHGQIMDDAVRSRYDWCAPVTEIARVVPAFQKKYRDDIYRAVLDCFYHIQAERTLTIDTQEAVWECFLDLKDDTEQNRKAKEFYASRHVENAISCGPTIFHMHYGNAWRQFLDEFRKGKGQEWRRCKTPEDLQNWSDSLENDLAARLEAAEESGVFEKDDAEGMSSIFNVLRNVHTDIRDDPSGLLSDLRLE